jgi:hypothetical protein
LAISAKRQVAWLIEEEWAMKNVRDPATQFLSKALGRGAGGA